MGLSKIRLIGTDTQPSNLPDSNSEVAVVDLSNTTTVDLEVNRINPYPEFSNDITVGAGGYAVSDKSNWMSYNIELTSLNFNQTTFNTLNTIQNILSKKWNFIETISPAPTDVDLIVYPILVNTADKVVCVALDLNVNEGTGTVDITLNGRKVVPNV